MVAVVQCEVNKIEFYHLKQLLSQKASLTCVNLSLEISFVNELTGDFRLQEGRVNA